MSELHVSQEKKCPESAVATQCKCPTKQTAPGVTSTCQALRQISLEWFGDFLPAFFAIFATVPLGNIPEVSVPIRRKSFTSSL